MKLGKIIDGLNDQEFPFQIRIECEGREDIDINSLEEFQGELKKRTESDVIKILRSIRDYGFSFPFFYWKSKDKRYVFDGHGRLLALLIFKKTGGKIPLLPACQIKAKDEDEAKQKLLRLNSRYGIINLDGLKSFVDGLDINLDDLELPDIEGMLDDNTAIGWNPDKYEEIKNGDDIIKRTGYGLQSFWKDIKPETVPFYKYSISLPKNKSGDIIKAKYSRTNLEEIRRIIFTYMRTDDFFLESCCGWSTFGSAAKYYGYSGIGVDIWDTAIEYSKRQLTKMPGNGKIEIKKMNALDLSFKDDYFDFLYCNPPFANAETYSNSKSEIGDKNINNFNKKLLTLMTENYRVIKKNCLCVMTIADLRKNGQLVSYQKHMIEAGLSAGFNLHDFVVAEVESQRIRLRKKDYGYRRTAKCHEYVIVFKK